MEEKTIELMVADISGTLKGWGYHVPRPTDDLNTAIVIIFHALMSEIKKLKKPKIEIVQSIIT